MIRNNMGEYFDKRDLSVQEVHERTGISRSSLTRYFRNQVVNINMDTLSTLCETFNCDPWQFFTFIPKDEMTDDDVIHVEQRATAVAKFTSYRRKKED